MLDQPRFTGSPVHGVTLLADAIEFAHTIHSGQTDRFGEPAIDHSLRLMVAMGSEEEKVVAVLHDTIAAGASRVELRDMIGERLLMAVTALSLLEDGVDSVTYDQIAADRFARAVKLACIADSLEPVRLAALDPFTRRRRLNVTQEAAWRLGTTVDDIVDAWGGGRSPYR